MPGVPVAAFRFKTDFLRNHISQHHPGYEQWRYYTYLTRAAIAPHHSDPRYTPPPNK